MFFGKSDQQQSDKRVEALTKTIEQLENRILQMQEAERDARSADVLSSTFAIDFNIMRVFAIERNIHNNLTCTIVGHFVNEPVAFTDDNVHEKDIVREWYLYCSQEQHEKLVAEFNAFKNSK